MNSIFENFLRKFVFVFFDGILICSPVMVTHLIHLRQVLDTLKSHSLFCQNIQMPLGQSRIECLGHMVTSERVMVDPAKVECLMSWPEPTNGKALRFLGNDGILQEVC